MFPALRRKPLSHRLWLVLGAVALFLATSLVAILVERSSRVNHSPAFGLDFIAFYTGGSFVNEGRADQLFNLRAVQAFQRELAERNGVKLGDALGPWWNPPFYAWVFSPLARLSFGAATTVWIAINVLCTGLAAWLLVRMLRSGVESRVPWQTWSLVPAGIFLSTPFIQSVTHGQNTGTSLLLVTLIAIAWRSGRGMAAGLLGGLLFYKPQLGAVLAGMLVLSLGWRALAGLALSGMALLAVTLLTMPGALGQFLHQMPANVDFVQTQCVYMWERHATFKAFWRLLLQGRATGVMGVAAITLTSLSVAGVALGLVRISPLWRWLDPFGAVGSGRERGQQLDRLIAATIAATPLLTPFYFDYDLLLLAVPAVLVARDVIHARRGMSASVADRWLAFLWPALYAWLLINADIAERTHVNLAVPLLTSVAGLLVARRLRREAAVEREQTSARPLAAAA